MSPAARGKRDPRALSGAAAFVLVALTVFLLSLDGGAYDIVVRQRAAMVLWWILALAVLAGLLPRRWPSRSGMVVIVGLLLYGMWTAVSFLWTSSDERTLTEVARVGAHLGVVVLLGTALGPRTWRPAVAGATTAAVAVCVAALGSRLHHGLLGTDYVSLAFNSPRRLEQPFGYWNAVGAWASMTALLCLGWSAHNRRGALRGLALAAVPVAVAVAYLTYSRASIAGGALGLLVLLAISRNRWTMLVHAVSGLIGGLVVVLVIRHEPAIAEGTSNAGAAHVVVALVVAAGVLVAIGWATGRLRLDAVRLPRRVARVTLAVGAVMAVAAFAVASFTVIPDAWRSFRTVGVYSVANSSNPAARLSNLNGTRYQIWHAALHEFTVHPLDGSGAGTFEFAWNQHGSEGESIRDAHSLYIENLSELGVPGLLLILAVIAGILGVLARGLRTVQEPGAVIAAGGAVASYLVGAGVDWLWESTAVTVLMLTLVGCVIAATGRPALPLRVRWRIPLAVLALVICLIQLPGPVSTSEVRRSQSAAAQGDIAAAITHAGQAIASEPWASTPLVQRALVEEQSGQLAAAVADLQAAHAREPLNWRVPLILARVQARQGHVTAALAAYRLARSLRPRGSFFRQ